MIDALYGALGVLLIFGMFAAVWVWVKTCIRHIGEGK